MPFFIGTIFAAALAAMIVANWIWIRRRHPAGKTPGFYIVTRIGVTFGPFATVEKANHYPHSFLGTAVDGPAFRPGWNVIYLTSTAEVTR